MTIFTAQVASPGTALGLAYRTDRPRSSCLPERAGVQHIAAAFDAVAERLTELTAALRSAGRAEEADIVEVGTFIARDADLRAEAVRRAELGLSVGVAIEQAVDHYAGTIAALGDPALADRATDVRQVGKRALAWLSGNENVEPDGPLVLIGEEIGAADLLEATSPVVAALSIKGGPNSHAAIVARSLLIPLLIGIDPELLELADGAEVLVDGKDGVVRPVPPPDVRAAALVEISRSHRRRATYQAERRLPCRTLDQREVTLRANAATPADARVALAAGADGVGLLRTELPFLEAARWPTEAQHTAALAPVLRELAGRTVVVRTLDFADDKLPPFLAAGRQGRLGRGLPLMLAEPAAFGAQFRALLRAAPADSGLHIMIPMVAGPAELRSCQRLLNDAAAALGVPAPPLGVMIELPEAVESTDELAAEAAFLSIGSNDLTGQILGLDRRDPRATPMLTAHPRVLNAIATVVAAAHRHGRSVSVCGDAAANPTVMPLLVGLGCDVLSMAPAAVDEIRYRIRRLRYDDCQALAAAALARESAEEVWRLVDRHEVVEQGDSH